MSSATARPAKLLLTGPAGSGKTRHALGRIRAAATTPGPRGRGASAPGDALLVLPTYAQVMHVKRLALSRWDVRGLFDQPFTTFTAAGERFLPAFRVRALPSAEERDRLMEEALRQRDVPLFREIRDRPGFRAHLLRLVKEIKQTGLEGGEAREHLAAAREEISAYSREKLDGFLDVFECYEDLLERAALEDHEDALRRLAGRLEEEPPERPPGVLVVDGFDDFTRVEERILHALAEATANAGGHVLVTLPWDDTRRQLFAGSHGSRERLLARGFEEERLDGFPRSTQAPLAALAAHLFGAPVEPVEGGDAVQTLVAGDTEDEAETVARAVHAIVTKERPAGVRSWRDVGVVVRRLAEHAPRLESAFARLGVPLRIVGPGETLAGEPLVRALRGPLDVLAGHTGAGHFQASRIMEWLRWRALAVGDLPIAAVDRWDVAQRREAVPADYARLRADAPAELAGALAVLDDLVTTLAPLEEHAQLYAGLAHAVEVLTPLPEPSGFDADGRPLDAAHDRRLARAVLTRARTTDILASLRAAAQRTQLGGAGSLAAAVSELHDAMERTTLRPPDRRLDAVTLMDPEEVRFWELPVIVLAGLETGAFPLRPREDVLLRDRDREVLRACHPALRLPVSREREVRERRLFYGAVTRAGTRLLLTRRAYDDAGDPKERSFFLRELECVVTPHVVRAARAPGRVARERDDCFTEQDLRLHAAAYLAPWAARRHDVTPEALAFAAAVQQESGSGVPARAARLRRRTSDALWHDAEGRADVLGRFVRATDLVSVSRLNHALRCPQRFYLHYVAGLERDDLTIDGPVFDFLDRGTALHHAFQLALEDPALPVEDLARAGADRVTVAGLDRGLLEAELRRALELLRDRERRTAGPLRPWTERGLEFRFGYEERVELGAPDCRFGIRGSVDRIDRAALADGTPVVSILDYKRSATSADRAFQAGRDGDDLQVPLYARALEGLLGVRVVGFEWFAGVTRSRRILHDDEATPLFEGRREAVPLATESHADFRARITEAEATATRVVRAARTGHHPRKPIEAGTCGDCPWKDVCRPDIAWLEARIGTDDAEGGHA